VEHKVHMAKIQALNDVAAKVMEEAAELVRLAPNSVKRRVWSNGVVDGQRQPELAAVSRKRKNWKKDARNKQIKLEADKFYSPAEVAAILGRSYDFALRVMKKMGASNLGSPTRRYKRGKSIYVVSGRKILDYLKSKQ
jgi:hypothetical protein